MDIEAKQVYCTVEHQAVVNDSSEDGSFFSLLTQDLVYKYQTEQELTIDLSDEELINNLIVYIIHQM